MKRIISILIGTVLLCTISMFSITACSEHEHEWKWTFINGKKGGTKQKVCALCNEKDEETEMFSVKSFTSDTESGDEYTLQYREFMPEIKAYESSF